MQTLRKIEKIIKKEVVDHIAYNSKMHLNNKKMSLRQVCLFLERSTHFTEIVLKCRLEMKRIMK